MKVYLWLPLILIGFCSTLLAQPLDKMATIDWSESYDEPNNSFLSKIIHSDQTGFYALRVQGLGNKKTKPNIFVEYYDKNEMRLKKSAELDLNFKNKRRDFEDVLVAGGNMYFLTSFNNQAKKKNYLFAQTVNKATLRPSKKLTKLAEVDTKNRYQEGGFRHDLSKDTSKILLYSMLPKKKRQPERFSLQVFDNQLTPIWEKEVQLPFNDENFAVQEYKVDNEGNVYMLGIIYEGGKALKKNTNYQYVVLAYRNNGNAVEEYKINLNKKFITDLTFRVDNKGDLIFSGFYSDKGNYSVKGTYFFRLNPVTKEIYNKNLKAFDFKFLTEYLSDNKVEKAKKSAKKGNSPELYRYALDDLILRSDGGAVLVAEQYYVQRRNNNNDFYGGGLYGGAGIGFRNRPGFYNNNFYAEEYEYYYNDIIVVNIQPSGEIEWTARIPKQQITTNDGGYFSSYAMSIVKDKFYFVFNDNFKNYEPKKNPNKWYTYTGRNSVITLAEINKNGEVNLEPLFSDTEASITTRPKVCKQVGRNDMIIYGERNRNFRFGNLVFE